MFCHQKSDEFRNFTILSSPQKRYFYGVIVIGGGNLVVPDYDFWYDLYFGLPEGVAIRPTAYSLLLIALWCLSQAVFELCANHQGLIVNADFRQDIRVL